MARRAPDDDRRAALIELSHRARRHGGGCRLIRVLHRAATVVDAADRRWLVAERAQDVEAGVDDVAVAQHVAAVPKSDRLCRFYVRTRAQVHSFSSSSVSCSLAKARTRSK